MPDTLSLAVISTNLIDFNLILISRLVSSSGFAGPALLKQVEIVQVTLIACFSTKMHFFARHGKMVIVCLIISPYHTSTYGH
jgi:hypothetical protein